MGINKDSSAKTSTSPIEFKQNAPSIFTLSIKIFLGLFLVFIIVAIYSFITDKKYGNRTNISSPVLSPNATGTKVKLLSLEGLAWKDELGQMIEIKEEDMFGEKDKLITGNKSRLVLGFDDGSVVRIGGKTRITLVKLNPVETRINNMEGELFARVQKTPNRRFFIEAGRVTVESLGTIFSVENKGEIIVNVFDHFVKVSDGNTEKEVGKKEQWRENQDTVVALKETDYENNKFISWSLAEESKQVVFVISPTITIRPVVNTTVKPTEKITSNPTVSPKGSGPLVLSGKIVKDGVVLDWKTTDLDIKKGFKLVKSLSENPVYPNSDSVVFESSASSSFYWEIKDGKKWHFRVCQSLESEACGVYSNDVLLEAPLSTTTPVTISSGNVRSINLTGEMSGILVKLNWTIDGYSSQGYEVVWSTDSSPVYPSRGGDSFHYYSDPAKRNDEITNLTSGKTYYFRICEYLGDKCGVYSNEVSYSF